MPYNIQLTKLCKEIHNDNVAKGFYDGIECIPRDYVITKQIMLIVTELAEAVEKLRKEDIDNTLVPYFPSALTMADSITAFEEKYKDRFQDEIGDTFIRLMDLCGYLDIDIDSWIWAKLQYNKTRKYKHGKKY